MSGEIKVANGIDILYWTQNRRISEKSYIRVCKRKSKKRGKENQR